MPAGPNTFSTVKRASRAGRKQTRAGQTVAATISVVNTPLEPVVTLGLGKMTATGESVVLEDGTRVWVFTRLLDGSEGEGIRKVALSGTDPAGNVYTWMEEEETVTLDFTLPTATCKSTPPSARISDIITVTVVASEPLQELPVLDASLDFSQPLEEPGATAFEFVHPVKEADVGVTEWTYAVSLTDLAGNESEGSVCTSGGSLDAQAPQLSGSQITTDPVVLSNEDSTVLAVGGGDQLVVTFDVIESQGVAAGYPQVVLDVAGAPLPMPLIEEKQLEEGFLAYVFALTFDGEEHEGAEGLWPVRVLVADTAGNALIEEALLAAVVRVDFTAPVAECALIPEPGDAAYPLGQKLAVQVAPMEELENGFEPTLLESFAPELASPFFAWNDEHSRFSGSVLALHGEAEFELSLQLRDLVGNETAPGETACTAGVLYGHIDGVAPHVVSVDVVVDGGAVNPATTPLRAGLEIAATIVVHNTVVKPDVFLGNGEMDESMGPTEFEEEVFEWVFVRTLDGTEGEGIRKISLTGADEAGNKYSFVEEGQTVLLDFTPPTATCKSTPDLAKLNDEIIITANTTEKVALGLPVLEASMVFQTPPMAPNATLFEFKHKVTPADALETTWNYSLKLTDLAGNETVGACAGGGFLDAVRPEIGNGAVETLPEVVNHQGVTILAAGHDDQLVARFTVMESQDIAAGYPKVSLDVTGSPVSFEQTDMVPLGEGTDEFTFALLMSAVEHAGSEGYWPVRVQVLDVAGNLQEMIALVASPVRVDFTPPAADCALIPAPGETGYPIGQKLSLVVSPVEELEPNSVPLLEESILPDFAGPFFKFDEGTKYRFSRTVGEDDGELEFEVGVVLRDLVGNETPPGANACQGVAAAGAVDGERPEVLFVEVSLDPPDEDPTTVPLRAGRTLVATIELANTAIPPDVRIGTGIMSADAPEPVGDGPYTWSYTRTLDGSEGEGPRKVLVEGGDAAGNTYSYTTARR